MSPRDAETPAIQVRCVACRHEEWLHPIPDDQPLCPRCGAPCVTGAVKL